jgi:hypothetical protein
VAVGPNFRPFAGLADPGVVRRHCAFGGQPHQLALQLVGLLRRRPLVVFAQRDKQVALPVERQLAAEVIADRQLGQLAEDHLEVFQPRAVFAQTAVADRRAGFAALARFGEAEVHPSAGGEVGGRQHLQQAALPLGVNLRHASDRRRQAFALLPQPQPAGPLGDKQALFRRLKGQRPRVFQAVLQLADRRRGVQQAAAQQQTGQQSQSGHGILLEVK